jgi:hypothetical protein
MIMLIYAGWCRNDLIRRELPHSNSAGFGFPYRIARSRILLSKLDCSTFCLVHYLVLFFFISSHSGLNL